MSRSDICVEVIVAGLLAGAFPASLAATAPTSPAISAIWANNGADKITRDELRASGNPGSVINRVWDGTEIRLFGARNEVVAFNLCLEAADAAANNVSVTFNRSSEIFCHMQRYKIENRVKTACQLQITDDYFTTLFYTGIQISKCF